MCVTDDITFIKVIFNLKISRKIRPVRSVEMASLTSWRDRRFIFNGQNLSKIALEFNRYNRMKIIIGDAALNSVEFDGIFDASDPKSFIKSLELTGHIEARLMDKTEIHLFKK